MYLDDLWRANGFEERFRATNQDWNESSFFEIVSADSHGEVYGLNERGEKVRADLSRDDWFKYVVPVPRTARWLWAVDFVINSTFFTEEDAAARLGDRAVKLEWSKIET